VLAFLIPIDAMDWQQEYEDLRREVEAYSAELARIPHCVVFTKLDLLGEDYLPPIEAPDAFGFFAISAAARTGLDPLLAGWWRQLLSMRRAAERPAGTAPLP
jgi:GTP-binding protein